MGKLKLFDISFANANGVYYAGSVLQGHVTVELNQTIKMTGIKLLFEGRANVSWTESETVTNSDNTTSTVTHTHSATENYFEQFAVLYGMLQGGKTIELSSGRHEFPFDFQLPADIPSSFEEGDGHVRYIVKATIDIPWRFDYNTKRAFTVISILDLNQLPDCSNRLQATKKKTICCWCCASRPIEATFTIERQGYVPGEAIHLNGEISNDSNRRINKSFVSLKMVTTYYATSDTKKITKELARVTRPGFPSHQDDLWYGEKLVIPPLPPSYLNGCKIIDIHYILQLTVVPSGLSKDLLIPLEIIIGTIPLTSVVPQDPVPTTYGSALVDSYSPFTQRSLQELPPPSYNECITGRVNIRDKGDNDYTRGSLEYAPAYTYYDWGNKVGPLPQ